MKLIRNLILFIAIFGVTFFVWKGFFASAASTAQPSPAVLSAKLAQPSPSPEEVFEVPIKLIVPKLGIHADVESVGMDSQGRMDVPKGVTNVAWYNLGFKPGQTGNAVFAGHFDKPDGNPSVFYKLDTLEKGDLIQVQDSSGTKTFEVKEKRVVDLVAFPLQEVFGEVNKKRVNLITCGGIWDKTKKEYSKRTVIFSELKSS